MSPRCEFGYEIPKNNSHDRTIELDKYAKILNKKTLFKLKLTSKQSGKSVKTQAKKNKVKTQTNFKKIRVHFVCYVNHGGLHKARLVADDRLNDFSLSSVHSKLASFKGIRLFLFLAGLKYV